MDKNNFRILKEYTSLKNSIPELEKIIAEELARIDKIEVQRERRSTELTSIKSKLEDLSQELAKTEKEIFHYSEIAKKAKASISLVFTEDEINGLTKQYEHASGETDRFEEQGLELIDQISEAEEFIQNAQTFIKGSQETIKEIEAEINASNEDVFSEIKIKKRRIEILLEQLPEKVVNKLSYLNNKGPKFIPVSEITEKNTCQSCGNLVPMAILTSIETHQRFHTCQACERILIPQSTKY